MAFTRVQASAKTKANATSVTIPLTTQPTLGNALVVFVHWWLSGASTPTVTDTHGNAYTVVQNRVFTNSHAAILLCPRVTATGASFSITVTAASSAFWVAQAVEYSGAALGLQVEATTGASASSAAPATGATAALTSADVIQAAGYAIAAAQGSITVVSATPVWTQEFEELVFTHIAGEANSRLVTGAAGTTPSCSWTGTAGGAWAAVLAVFRAKASVPAGTIALIASTSATPGAAGGTTTAIDTTGATLVVVSIASSTNALALTDSKGNTWFAVPRTSGAMTHRLYYALSPTVGTGHTVTVTGTNIYPAIRVLAFANVNTLQAVVGATGTTSPLVAGMVTPSMNGALVLTALASDVPTVPTDTLAPSGFTVTTQLYVGGTNMQQSLGYLVQPTAAALTPTWSWTGTRTGGAAVAAVFLPTPAAVVERAQTFVFLPL